MPEVLDAWPEDMTRILYAHLEEYMDGRVYVFNEDDVRNELRPAWEADRYSRAGDKFSNVNLHVLLRSMRGRLSMVARRKGGSFMYKASIRGDLLYFVYGERTCLIKWCTVINVNNTGRCEQHQKEA